MEAQARTERGGGVVWCRNLEFGNSGGLYPLRLHRSHTPQVGEGGEKRKPRRSGGDGFPEAAEAARLERA